MGDRELHHHLEHHHLIFVETSDESRVEESVRKWAVAHGAHVTVDTSDTSDTVDTITRQATDDPDRMYVYLLPEWQRFTGNEIVLRFGPVFHEDAIRYGPNSWCDPRDRTQRLNEKTGRFEPMFSKYDNLRVVFCGSRDPLSDTGLKVKLTGRCMVFD